MTRGHSPGPAARTSAGRPGARGFTMVEAMVVVAIVGIVAALAWSSLAREQPRAHLADGGSQLQTLLHGARQQAIATGHDVVVMFFPQYVPASGQLGRVVAVEDAAGDFFIAPGTPHVNFGNYDPSAPAYGVGGQLLTVLDLPSPVVFGPSAGLGGATLAPPFDTVDVSKACSFCNTGGDGRGAIRFDDRGRATFYQVNGSPYSVTTGASVSLNAPGSGVNTVTTLVITSTSGATLVFSNG